MHRFSLRGGGPRLALAAGLCLVMASLAPHSAKAATPIYVRTDGHDTSCNGTADAGVGAAPNCAVATIQKGVDLVDAGGTIHVRGGTYVVGAQVTLNKALTIDGAGAGSTILQVSGAGYRFLITASGVTIQNVEIVKTDKPGVQNIIGVQASNATIQDNVIHGQYVYGDGDVSRALEFAGGLTGILVDDNTIYGLRQPGYVNGVTTGTISDNVVYGTRGWVVAGGNLSFTGNSWGSGNVLDIVFLDTVTGPYYGDIVAISNANNGAVVEDQRPAPDVLAVALVDGGAGPGGNGGASAPYQTIAQALPRVASGGTIRAVGTATIPGGTTVTTPGVTIDLNHKTGGAGSPFLTVTAADVTLTNAVLDGGGSGSPAVLVNAGGDNFTLSNSEVKNWADAVEVAASVTSFKMFGNWIHDNADAGLQVDGGVALGGVVTVEGNLFKDDGGNGIRNDGTTNPLPAERNSWGDVGGPTGPNGDGASAAVDYTPYTFAELHLDMDPATGGDQTSVDVSEGSTFDASLKLDAQKVNSIQFKVTFDPAYLTLNSTTFLAPWLGQCFDNGSSSGVVKKYCILFGGEYDGGTLATLNFTAANPPPGPGPWPTNLDIAHLEADTAASALGGAKIFLNNAGYNAPSVASRDITDTNDGTVNIIGKANYNGFIDLQGRTNDSGAKLRVFDIATKSGSTELAQGTSASSGSYATAHNVGYQLLVGSTYWLLADRNLFVATTAEVSTTYSHSKLLSTRPFTTLVTLVLRGGDAYNDNMIDISDASCIGAFYGTMSSACGGGSPVGSSPDVNEDGTVNILDLSLMGGNYGITSSTWAP